MLILSGFSKFIFLFSIVNQSKREIQSIKITLPLAFMNWRSGNMKTDLLSRHDVAAVNQTGDQTCAIVATSSHENF